MKLLETDRLGDAQKESVHQLWNREYPGRLQHASADELGLYLDSLGGQQHLLLLEESGELAAWCFAFEREGGRWFAIIVRSDRQGLGHGRALLTKLKSRYPELNGWVIDHGNEKRADGSPYASPLPFYLANGFATLPGTRLETKKISAVKIIWRAVKQ